MTVRIALPSGWPLFAVSLAAWAMLLSAGRSPMLPAWCGPAGHAWASVPDRMDAMMRVTSPRQLLLSWALMLCAMMAPLLPRPLAAIDDRRAVAGFVVAYVALWVPAIGLIGLAAVAFSLATQAHPYAGGLVALGIATAWQGSTIKARCLARCHHAAAVGGLAEGAAFALACIGACWAAMLLPYFAGTAHLSAMLVVTALLLYERGIAPKPKATPIL